MKAVLVRGYNQGLEYVEDAADISQTPIGPDDVLVRVIGAGVNPADYKILQGDLSLLTSLKFPCSLGFDFSGTVDQVGPKVANFKKGDSVFGKLSPWEVFSSGHGAYSECVFVLEYSFYN